MNTLLDTIGVEAQLQKNVRLGKYKEPTEGEQQGSRPLKVSFRDHKTQQEIMNNIKKIKGCTRHTEKPQRVLRHVPEWARHSEGAPEIRQRKNWAVNKLEILGDGPPWKFEEIGVKKIKS